MTENRQKFGKLVRSGRKEQGLGLRQLARILDMDYSRLSRIERGERPPPDLDSVVRMAGILDLDQQELLKLAGVPQTVISKREGPLEEELINWVPGRVVGKKGQLTLVQVGEETFSVASSSSTSEVEVGIRPQDITLFVNKEKLSGSSARNRIQTKIEAIEPWENYNLVTVKGGGIKLDVAITDTSLSKMELSPGTEVLATFKATAPIVRERTPAAK